MPNSQLFLNYLCLDALFWLTCVLLPWHWANDRCFNGKFVFQCSSCASLVTSTTALERDKTIGGSTWTQYNNSEYADLSSFTYHQNYPALETDKAIGRCTNERGKTLPKAGGKSLPEDLTVSLDGVDPQVYWQTNILHTGKEGANFLYFRLTLLPHLSRLVKREVTNGVFIFAKL